MPSPTEGLHLPKPCAKSYSSVLNPQSCRQNNTFKTQSILTLIFVNLKAWN